MKYVLHHEFHKKTNEILSMSIGKFFPVSQEGSISWYWSTNYVATIDIRTAQEGEEKLHFISRLMHFLQAEAVAEEKEVSNITFFGTLKSPVIFIRLLNLFLQVTGFSEIQKEKKVSLNECWINWKQFSVKNMQFYRSCLHQTVCDRAVVFSYFVIIVIFRNIHSIY